MSTVIHTAPREAHEQTRARYPDEEGFIERDGVRVFWESYGEGEQTVLFLPTWTLVHSRVWKAQIAYLARHFRVVTFDPRGNGRSDRPRDPARYAQSEFAADALAVLDAAGTERAAIVSFSNGAQRALLLSVRDRRRRGDPTVRRVCRAGDAEQQREHERAEEPEPLPRQARTLAGPSPDPKGGWNPGSR